MKIAKIDCVSAVETFNVTSNALRVTDPCYDMQTWCAGTLDKVRNGTWDAHVGYHKDSLDAEMGERYLQGEKERIDKFATLHEKDGLGGFVKHEYDRLEEMRKEFDARPGRVAFIHIVAQGFEKEFNHEETLNFNWERSDIDVGVDSGQAGFFDVFHYASAVSDKEDGSRSDQAKASKFEAFYDAVCNLTIDDKSFGVVEFGCVSSSGYGDGGYTCYLRRNSLGEAIEALIAFIEEDEEENED